MLIALLSDSHDHAANLQAALALLAPHNPILYIHTGDLCSPAMLRYFAHLPAGSVHFVFGNNDFDQAELRAEALRLNIVCHGRSGELHVGNKKIVFTHGDSESLNRQLFALAPDYFIHGHTHRTTDTMHKNTRIINPGALHRATPKTVALLNPETDTLQFLRLPPADPHA